MQNTPFIVLDLETTGLSARRHKITEIAAVKVFNNQIIDKFQTLINPEVSIPRFITKLTGITNDMVKEAPVINDVLPKFKDFIGDHTIIAHNATFDYGFLLHNFYEHDRTILNNETICTVKLANRLLPHLPSKKLSSVCEYYEITNKEAHRAMSDVLATTEVFSKFLEQLAKSNITEEREIIKFNNLPRQKAQMRLL